MMVQTNLGQLQDWLQEGLRGAGAGQFVGTAQGLFRVLGAGASIGALQDHSAKLFGLIGLRTQLSTCST